MKISTVERMSLEDFQSMTDFGVMSRSTEAMRAVPRGVYELNTTKALWDPELDPDVDQGTKCITFPHLSVLVLWFDMSMGDCIWATKLLAEQRELYANGTSSKARHIDFVCLPGKNHFVGIDMQLSVHILITLAVGTLGRTRRNYASSGGARLNSVSGLKV
jgi:hypothetical protein